MVPPIRVTTTVENLPWVHTPADTSLIPGTTARRCVPEQWTLTINGERIARIVRHFPPDRRDFTLYSPLLGTTREWPYNRASEHRSLEAAQTQMHWLLSRRAAKETAAWVADQPHTQEDN